MDALKMSLINRDYAIQARTDLQLDSDLMEVFSSFLNRVREELVTGQTAYLHIEGKEKDAITLEISQYE